MKNTAALKHYPPRKNVYLYYFKKSKSNKSIWINTGIEAIDPNKKFDLSDYKKDTTTAGINREQTLRKRLDRLDDLISDYLKENDDYPPISYIKEHERLFKSDFDNISDLCDLFLTYKKEDDDAKLAVLRGYNSLKTFLLKYETDVIQKKNKDKDAKIDLNMINQKFVDDLVKWATSDNYRRDKRHKDIHGLQNSTALEYKDKLGALVRWAVENKHIKPHKIDWSDKIHKLTKLDVENEIIELPELAFLISKRTSDFSIFQSNRFNTDNAAGYKKVLDTFIFQCMSGLRFSDVIRIKKQHIQKNRLIKRAKKTGAISYIPLSDIMFDLLKDNDYDFSQQRESGNPNKPLADDGIQRYNTRIKAILKKFSEEYGSFKETSNWMFFTGDKENPMEKEKWERISSHAGRRAYCTNADGLGVSWTDIKRVTGHGKDNKSFSGYIQNGSISNSNNTAVKMEEAMGLGKDKQELVNAILSNISNDELKAQFLKLVS